MLAFTALDIRELVHHFLGSRSGLAFLATLVALVHLPAAAAFTLARFPDRQRSSTGGVADAPDGRSATDWPIGDRA
jgi:hypothetical protein